MAFLLGIWTYIVDNILKQPAFFIGFMVLFGYVLLKKPWYESIAGFLKATVGYLILQVGSGGLVSNFRPILVGLKDKFNLEAMVIDPYFGQNAVDQGLPIVFGRTFSSVMILLLIAFVVNILLVKFKKYTKIRSVFTTGHVQIQQSATAFWLILWCFPKASDTHILIIMGLILGTYWAVGSNLTVELTQELTNGAGFCVAHHQMFGIAMFSKLAEKMGKKSKKLEDIEFPGFLTIFNDNMVSTAILMLLFFGTILMLLGSDFLILKKFMQPNESFLFYILKTCLNFSVYLGILQLGVRTFVTELTQSFLGISTKLLPGAIPGIDCAAVYGFGSPNAVTIGFISGAIGQFLAIIILILFKSPVLVIAGFVPLFFDNATLGVFANNKGGLKATIVIPIICGLTQVFGSALIASAVGMSAYGGYIGTFDWAVVWPIMVFIIKYLGYIGAVIVFVGLLIIPQLQYKKHPDTYFSITDDFNSYKKLQE